MSRIDVQPVSTAKQQQQFLNFPWKLYDGDPFWVPPIRQDEKELVGFARHPFHEYATVQPFLALRDGQPVGRVAGIVNPEHNRRYGEQRGFFGFFESEDDPNVAVALFDAVAGWLREQEMTDVRGPVNPSLNYTCGLLIDGFDSLPTFMMTYNKPYYPSLLEQVGLEKSQDMFAYWGHVEMIDSLDKKMAFIVEEAKKRFDIRLRELDRRRFHDEVRMFLDIYNKSLVGTWGFTPLSSGEVDHLARSLRYLIVPEMTSVAEVDGKPVGAVFGLLDYNPRVKAINGRLFPFGFMRLLANKRKIKRVRLISTNVVPEYQKWGLGLVLMSRLVSEVFRWGIEEAEFSWVLESNHLSRATLERGGAQLTKTYRIYDKSLMPASSS